MPIAPDLAETRPLGQSGFEVPVFGFGAAHLGELYQKLSDANARAAVEAAWESGVRYFDTAPWYGHGLSEHRLGEVLRSKPRDVFTLSTKVGRIYQPSGKIWMTFTTDRALGGRPAIRAGI